MKKYWFKLPDGNRVYTHDKIFADFMNGRKQSFWQKFLAIIRLILP